tara:strand:+ start:124 stop:396 length:273 start_codon:yes stop_codon:yes gene_type:complete
MWKEDDDDVISTYSDKTIVDLGLNDLITNGPEVDESKIESLFVFWTKKMHRNITQLDNDKITLTNKFYEIHTTANLTNLDVSSWAVDEKV